MQNAVARAGVATTDLSMAQARDANGISKARQGTVKLSKGSTSLLSSLAKSYGRAMAVGLSKPFCTIIIHG